MKRSEEELLVKTLKGYHNVYACSPKVLEGVDRNICQHSTPTREATKPIKQRRYSYNGE